MREFWRRYAPFILVAAVSSLLTSAMFLTFMRLHPTTTAQPAPVIQKSADKVIAPVSDVFITARKKVEPAVVYLDVQSVQPGLSLPDEDFFPFLTPFRDFFGPQI
ncbi:MAG: hypothetical protein GX493_10355, partial [Firmicutes bacterium]|nr:hypothetical protein [Bacillota bacterium]